MNVCLTFEHSTHNVHMNMNTHIHTQQGDNHQLLRLYGTKCKLRLDPKTAGSLDSMMSVSVASSTEVGGETCAPF